MSFIIDRIDPMDIGSLVPVDTHWDYSTLENNFQQEADYLISKVNSLAELNTLGLADKMSTIKAFATERMQSLIEGAYTIASVYQEISDQVPLFIDEIGCELRQIPMSAANDLMTLVRDCGQECSLAISSTLGDVFGFAHTIALSAVSTLQNTFEAMPTCVDYPNFKVVLANGIHEETGINDFLLENVILAFDMETNTIWFNTTLTSLENHVKTSVLELDRALLEQNGCYSLIVKVIEALQSPADFINAMKASVEELFASLFGDIADLYHDVINVYNNYGIGGVISFLIKYLSQGKDLVSKDGRIAFTDNAKYKTSSWIGGMIGAALGLVVNVVGAIFSLFSRAIGIALTMVGGIITTIAKTIQYNIDELQNARINDEATLPGFPYGVVSSYSLFDPSIYAMVKDNPILVKVPGGYFIACSADGSEDEFRVQIELHIEPQYESGNLYPIFRIAHLHGKQTEYVTDSSTARLRSFYFEDSQEFSDAIDDAIDQCVRIDPTIVRSYTPEQLDKALPWLFAFNFTLAYISMARWIIRAKGSGLNLFDVNVVSKINGYDPSYNKIILRTADTTSDIFNFTPSIFVSAAFFILGNSHTGIFKAGDSLYNYDSLVKGLSCPFGWTDISNSEWLNVNTVPFYSVDDTAVFATSNNIYVPKSITLGVTGVVYIDFDVSGHLFWTKYTASDVEHPAPQWQSNWTRYMLSHFIKEGSVIPITSANGYAIETPKYARNTFIQSLILSTVAVTAIALTGAVIGFKVNKYLRVKSSQFAADAEAAWSAYTKEPTYENLRAYRKAVRKNNALATIGYGTKLSKDNYWGGESDPAIPSGNLDSYFEQLNLKIDGQF